MFEGKRQVAITIGVVTFMAVCMMFAAPVQGASSWWGYTAHMKDSSYNGLASVTKWQVVTETSETDCMTGAYCSKTAAPNNNKLKHMHLGVDGGTYSSVTKPAQAEFTSTQKDNNHNYMVATYPDDCTTDALVSLTTAVTSCHGYALERSSLHLFDTAQQIVFQDEYSEVTTATLYAVGDRCEHANNHTSIITELDEEYDEDTCTTTTVGILKVESKWGINGAYETDPDIYGGVSKVWTKDEEE